MKALFCQQCSDLISPSPVDGKIRWCHCERHAVWWVDGAKGFIRVHDKEGPTVAGPAEYNRRGWLIGVSNVLLLADPTWLEDPEFWDTMSEQDPKAPSLFRKYGTLVVRFHPGQTGDSAYAPLPQ